VPSKEPTPNAEQFAAIGLLLELARKARIDIWTAEVVTALRAHGVRPILLKGPAVSRWLYPLDPEARTYVDVDLMVSPSQLVRTETVLREMGFEKWSHPFDDGSLHAATMKRADGAGVDLHWTLHNADEVPRLQMWEEVSTDTETIEVGGVDVEIPGVGLRVMHLVFQLPFGSALVGKPTNDLLRALDVVPIADWRRGAEVATRLGLDDVMGAKLRMLPAAVALADELGLPKAVRPALKIEARREVWCIASFRALPTWRAKARCIGLMIVPPPDEIRKYRPRARSGPVGLVIAYLSRAVSVAVRLPGAVLGWRRIVRPGP